MKQLVNDEGINQYQAVKDAYEKAKALLTLENPNRKELSDLLDVFDKNTKGVEWLRDEEGEDYNNFCLNAGKQFFLYAVMDAANTAKKKEMEEAVCKFLRVYQILGYDEKQFAKAIHASVENLTEKSSLDACRNLLKAMQKRFEPLAECEDDNSISKAYLYEKQEGSQRFGVISTYTEWQIVRRIVFPSKACWILRNPMDTKKAYVSPKGTNQDSIEQLVEGFKDFGKADGLNGEWLKIDNNRKIRAISPEESQKIFAYAEFIKGSIEGNYEYYMKVQNLIENLLGITKQVIYSPDIPTP